jgi:hypothetical protein
MKDVQGRTIGASKVARDITERKRMECVLREAELSGRLLQLQDEERTRVARELHDGVGQLLAALHLNASKIANEKAKLSPLASRSADIQPSPPPAAAVHISSSFPVSLKPPLKPPLHPPCPSTLDALPHTLSTDLLAGLFPSAFGTYHTRSPGKWVLASKMSDISAEQE